MLVDVAIEAEPCTNRLGERPQVVHVPMTGSASPQVTAQAPSDPTGSPRATRVRVKALLDVKRPQSPSDDRARLRSVEYHDIGARCSR